MQPYLFPYFPYMQLLACVDIFIIFDTAQFIARGWANRNAIALQGKRHRFVLPVRKHARDTSFADTRLANNFDNDLARFRITLDRATRFAPFHSVPQHLLDATFPLAIHAHTPFVDAFERMASALMSIIGFQTTMVRASQLGVRTETTAQDYIIRLVKRVDGDHFVNPIGGTTLYDPAVFSNEGLRLSFLQTTLGEDGDFPFHDLSVLDCVARHPGTELHRRLNDFVFIDGPGANGIAAESSRPPRAK
jgi:hypothetical protein